MIKDFYFCLGLVQHPGHRRVLRDRQLRGGHQRGQPPRDEGRDRQRLRSAHQGPVERQVGQINVFWGMK